MYNRVCVISSYFMSCFRSVLHFISSHLFFSALFPAFLSGSQLLSSFLVSFELFSSDLFCFPPFSASPFYASCLNLAPLSSSSCQLLAAHVSSSHVFSPLLTSSMLFSRLVSSYRLISALLSGLSDRLSSLLPTKATKSRLERAKNEKKHQQLLVSTLVLPFHCDLQAASRKRPWNYVRNSSIEQQ